MLFLVVYYVFASSNTNCIDNSCTLCAPGFFNYKNSCLSICPSGYTSSSMDCIQSESLTFINEDFTGFLLFSEPRLDSAFKPFPREISDSVGISSPVQTRDRGAYFSSRSGLVSSRLLVPGPDLTILLTIRVLTPGKILHVLVNSLAVLIIECDTDLVKVTLMYEEDSAKRSLLISAPAVIGEWNKIVFCLSQTHEGLTAQLQNSHFYVDSGEFKSQSTSTAWQLGNSGHSFGGFLAKISCTNEAILVPTEVILYNSCGVNEYYNPIIDECTESHCENDTWSISKNCEINDLENCIESVGFTEDLCKKCNNGAEDGKCGCGFRCVSCINDDPYQCDTCESGLHSNGGLCVYPCFNCNVTSILHIYEFSFKEFIPGSFHGFSSGRNTSSFQPFNNPESDDPIPSAYRGYYFNGSQFFRSEMFHISTRGAFAIWIKPENDGCIWCSQFLQIYSSLRLGAIFSNRLLSLFYFSGEITILDSWSFITVSIDYSLDPAITTIISGVNNDISQKISGNLLLHDISGVVGIGYHPKTTKEHFKGFLYYLKYWWGVVPQKFVQELESFTPSPQNSCNFNEFYNIDLNKCSDCHPACKDGCHTFASCSFCAELDCDYCSSFEDKECVKNSNSCIGNTWLSSKGTRCCSIHCKSGCTGPDPCDCLDINYHDKVSIDACCYSKCPSGFSNEGGKCTQTNRQIMSFDFWDHNEKKWQDVYGNTIYNINSMPFIQRGFYYYEAMAYISAIVLSQKFTIQLWMKQISPGKILHIDTLSITSYTNQTSVLTSQEIFQFDAIGQSWSVLIIKQYESPIGNYIYLQYYPNSASYYIKTDSCEFYSGRVSLSHSSQGFQGFLWKLAIFNDYVELFEDLNVCNEYTTSNCIWDCDPWQYWSSEACIPCSYSDTIDPEPSLCISHSPRRATASYTVGSCTHSSCPAGYSLVSTTCNMINQTVVDLSFDIISTTNFSDAYGNTLNVNSSIPSPVRGYYFKSTWNANITSILLSYTFSIYLWIKQISPGTILTFDALTLESTSSQLSLLIDSDTYSASSITSSWSIIIVQRYILLGSNYIGIQTYPDSTIITYSDPTSCEFFSGAIVLGAGTNSGFVGFIWMLSIYNGAYSASTSMVICNSIITSSCIWDCDLSQYFSSGVCLNCLSTCTTCRNQYDCNICANSYCSSCSYPETCTACITGAEIGSSVCQCIEGYSFYMTPTNQTTCRESGVCYTSDTRHTVDQCCYSSCPGGYSLSSAACTLVNQTIMDFTFDKISTTNFNDAYGNTYFVQSSVSAPIRGFYFTSTTSANISSVILSPSFSMYMWLKQLLPGVILSLDTLVINSTSTGLLFSIEDKSYPANSFTTSWTILIVNRIYSGASTITIQTYPDTNVIIFTESLACDFLSGVITLGTLTNPGFTGFIWILSLYNGYYTASTVLVVCSATVLNSCLWDCSISQYLSSAGVCSACSSACSPCRNPYDCKICINSVCSACADYYTCTACIATASLVNNVCECNEMYYAGFTLAGVTVCRESGICVSGDTRHTVDQCCFSVCPNGYSLTSVCTLTNYTAMDFLCNTFIQTQISDSYGNVLEIGSPPFPYKQRGYYFVGNCYTPGQTVMVASHSTILHMWTKIYGPGLMVTIDNLQLVSTSTQYIVTIGVTTYIYSPVVIGQWTVLILQRWTDNSMNGYLSFGVYLNNQVNQMQFTEPLACNFISGKYNIGLGFTGFMWEFALYNTIEPIAIDLEVCSTIIVGSCLWNCDPGYALSGGLCPVCPGGCSNCNGVNNDCNVCVSSLCASCDSYTTCTTCVVGGQLVNGLCQCSITYFEVVSSAGVPSCSPCSLNCLTGCTGSLPCQCSSITASEIYNVVNCCYAACPSGFVLSGSTCNMVNSIVLDFNFNVIEYASWTDLYGNTIFITVFGETYSSIYAKPVPADSRGYYFSPIASATTSSLNLLYTFTLNIWIKILSPGIVFSLDTFSITAETSALSISLDGNTYSFSTMKNIWSMLIVQTWEATTGHYILADFYPNLGVTMAYLSICRFLVGEITLGSTAVSSGFTGFIMEITVYNEIFNYAGTISVCGSTAGCVWDCDIDQFYDGTQCSACLSSCASCRDGSDCNLCANSLCTDCSVYDVCSACTQNAGIVGSVCVCNIRYYPMLTSPGVSVCDSCNETCLTHCSGSKPCQCDTVTFTTPVNVDYCCYSACPTGYSLFNSECSLVSTTVLHFTFDNFDQIVDSYGNMLTSTLTVASPFRGYYYDATAYSVSNHLILLYTNTIQLWIRQYSFGILFSLGSLSCISSNGVTSIGVSSYSYTFPYAVETWSVLILKRWLESSTSTLSLQYYPTSPISLHSESSLCDFFDGELHLNDASNPFVGFIWQLIIYNGLVDLSPSLTLCSTAPVPNCLWDCGLAEYFDSTACQPCDSGCTTCVNSTASCNLCTSALCTGCSDFSTCSSCVARASLVESVCQCETVYYMQFIDQVYSCSLCSINCYTCSDVTICESCTPDKILVGTTCVCRANQYLNADNGCSDCFSECASCSDSKFYSCKSCVSLNFLDGVCLSICPIGYTVRGGVCNPDGDQIMRFTFSLITGMYNDSLHQIPAMTGKSSQFYPDLESDDPVPAKGRGIYFTGSSYLSLPNPMGTFLMLGLQNYIEFWLNPKEIGVLFDKTDEQGPLLSIKVNGNIEADIRIGSLIDYFICTNGLTLGSWIHVIIAIEYPVKIYCYFNSVKSGISTLSSVPFMDTINNKAYIGCDSSKINCFKGFVYEMNFYYALPNINTLVSTMCGDCEVCLPGQGCFSNCNITQYLEYGCTDCMQNCTNGCVRGSDCNLCQDPNCRDCLSFSSSSCTTCIGGYAMQSSGCVSCNTTQFFNNQTGTCENCKNPCIECLNDTVCTGCTGNSTLKSGTCICPKGYTLSDTCLRNYFSVIATVTSANIVNLIFTKDLSVSLTVNSIAISISEVLLNFTLVKINNSTWQVSPTYLSDILSTTQLTISFLSPLLSIDNSLMNAGNTTVSLFSMSQTVVSKTVAAVASAANTIVAGALGSALGSSAAMLNPSSLFNFLQILEIYNYVPLYQVNLSPAINQILDAFNVNSMTPNLMASVVPQSYGTPMTNRYYSFGINTSLFLINSGVYIMASAALVVSLIPSFIIMKICHPWIRKKYMSVYKRYKYALFTRAWVQSFLNMLFYATVAIMFSELKNSVQVTDFIVAVMVLVRDI